jgi:outer membrane receptor protein involved in Fe transport
MFHFSRGQEQTMKKQIFVQWVVPFILAALANVVNAQTSATGALTGVVSDSSGAVIQKAAITVTSQSTNETRNVISTSTGGYLVPFLSPGIYKVEIAKAGFRTAVYSDIAILISETARLDARLSVGAPREIVVVPTNAEQLQTDDAELGRVVNDRSVESLPLVTRNYTQIIALSPGVASGLNDAGALGMGGGEVSANGNPTNDNNFQTNGIESNDFMNGLTGGAPIPNPDAIEEFKVVTGPYSAANGRDAGASVDVVTKSGSNSFHGTLFEFFRNEALNANLYFFNANGVPRPILRQNQFGGALGGPIKKDKLFFFGSYQHTQQKNGLDGNCSATILTPPLTNDRSAAALGTLFAGQASLSSIFGPPGIGPAILPDGSNIDPAALKIMQAKNADGSYLIPTPHRIDTSAAFDVQGTSVFSIPCTFSEDQFVSNADYVVSAKSKITGKFFYASNVQTRSLPGTVPGAPSHDSDDYRNLSIDDTYVFNSNLVNQLTVGYNRTNGRSSQPSPFKFSDFGITVPSFDNNLPSFAIASDGVSFGGGQGLAFVQNTYVAKEILTYVKGPHSFQVGGGVERMQINSPGFPFPAIAVALNFADLLLGFNATQNTSASLGAPFSNIYESIDLAGLTGRAYRIWNGDVFFQDDFRVTPRFTLNWGLRYERDGAVSDASGHSASFFTSLANPNPPLGGTLQGWTVPQNFKGAVPQGVTRLGNNYGTLGRGQNTWNPRIGFAWRLPGTERLVLRGGYGLFRVQSTGIPLLQSLAAPPFSIVRFLQASANANATLDNPLPPFDLSTLPQFFPYSPTTTQTYQGFAPNYRPPAVQHYSLGLQTQLWKDAMWDIGFVGSRSTGLVETVEPNQANLASPSNPIRGETTNTVANIPQRVPIEGFGVTNLKYFSSSASTWYNSLQSSLTKRFSHGLQFLASYTWTRDLIKGSLESSTDSLGGRIHGNQFDPPYGPDNFNREQRFVISYSYEFPKPANLKSAKGRVLGGWALSGVTVAQSGQRLSAINGNDATNAYGITTDLVNYIPGCKAVNRSSLSHYINASCFQEPPVIGADGIATDFGTSPVGLITGPRQLNFDFAVLKRTSLGWPNEAVNLEFRSEFFNLFNHPVFADPINSFDSSAFGQITGTATNPRIIQFALKLNF